MPIIPVNANSAIIDTNQDAQFIRLNDRSVAEIINGRENVQVYQSKENVYIEAIQVNPTQQFINQSVNNPGGGQNQVQYNSNGQFTGSNAFTYDPFSMTLTARNISGNISGNITVSNVSNFHLGGGQAGYYLQTIDGNGNLGWAAAGAGNGNPGGLNTQVQYNDGGMFNGSNTFTFNKTTNTLNITATIGSNLLPNASNTLSLGSDLNRWKDLYLSNNSVYLGNTKISTDGSNATNTADLFVNDVRIVQLAITNNPTSTIVIGGDAPIGNVLPIVQLGGNANTVIQLGNSANSNITATSNGIVLPSNVGIVNGGVANFTGANVVGGTFSNVNIANATITNIGTISNGTSNIEVTDNSNIVISVAGNTNIFTATNNGVVFGPYSNHRLGSISNLHIDGGSANQFLQTDGNGNLAWSNAGAITVSQIDANSTISNSFVNVNALRFDTDSGFELTELGNSGSGNIKVSFASTFKTWEFGANGNAQSNLVASGTDTVAFRAGNGITFATSNTANAKFLQITANPSYLINGDSNVDIPAANGNVNISAAGNANILVVTGTGTNVAGYVNATGNVTGNNFTTGANAAVNFVANGFQTAIVAKNDLAANYTLTLPANDGDNGQVLSTDGSGVLSWITPSGGGNGSPGGSNTQLQFNNNGSFGGIPNVTWNSSTSKLSLDTVDNLLLGGGSNGQILTTDSNGNLSWGSKLQWGTSSFGVDAPNSTISGYVSNLLAVQLYHLYDSNTDTVSTTTTFGVDAISFENGIAVGYRADGASGGIAIGYESVANNNSIAIGNRANSGDSTNVIILNSTGTELTPATNNSLYVSTVRNDTSNTNNVMYFNTGTKEVTYGPLTVPAFTYALENFTYNNSSDIIGTNDIDVLTNSVKFYDFSGITAGTALLNFRGSSTRSFNSVLTVGQSLTATVIARAGANAFTSRSFIQIDGNNVTSTGNTNGVIRYEGNAAFTAQVNSTMAWTYTFMKTQENYFIVLASQTVYGPAP